MEREHLLMKKVINGVEHSVITVLLGIVSLSRLMIYHCDNLDYITKKDGTIIIGEVLNKNWEGK